MKTTITIVRVFLLAAGFLALGGSILLAQTIQTNGAGGGKWDSAGTWQGNVIPSTSNDVIILTGDSVEIATTITSI